MEDKKADIMTYTPSTALAPTGETASTAMAVQAKAMVEARYIMAERHPRDFDVVRSKFLHNCERPSFAEVAIYNKPIGKGVTGPSIRFAEAALRCMGNIDTPTFTVYDDDQKRIVRVCTTDLETNVTYTLDVTITKTVERRKVQQGEEVLGSRLNSYGDKLYILRATDDDILNKQNALISKAVRTLGLRLVDGDLVDEGMFVVRQTLAKKDKEDPDGAKKKLFDGFESLGVLPNQLKEYLGHNNSTLNPKELADLRGLYAALRDGETTWREIMDSRKPVADPKSETDKAETGNKGGAEGLKDAIKSTRTRQANAEPASQPATTTKPNGHDNSDSDFFAN